jgi:hypothetical protein
VNTDFRRGFRDATRALGYAWPIAALTACLLMLGLAGVVEGQAAGSAASARAVQLRLLQGVALGLVVPLFAYAASGRVGARVEELMTVSWARYGGHRRRYALGRQAFAALLTGLVAGASGLFALGLGSATSAPGIELPLSASNLLAVLWVGLLGGLAYVGALGLAQSIAGNLGRVLFLVGDWLLGSGTSLLALPWPRAHLRALAGGDAALALSPRDAALCLGAIALITCLAWLRRVPS